MSINQQGEAAGFDSQVFTKEDFLKEYAKGSQMYIDLDPRVDFTKPVYEQVLALRAIDEAAGLKQEGSTPHEAA